MSSNDGVIVIFSNVHYENRRELNACLNQVQIMIIKIIYCINTNDHLVNPDNPKQIVSILPIKVCDILNLNVYLNLNILLTCLLLICTTIFFLHTLLLEDGMTLQNVNKILSF